MGETDPAPGGAKISARGNGYHFAGWIAPNLSHACGLHRPGWYIRGAARNRRSLAAILNSRGLISPEPDCVTFLVDSSKLASRGSDHQTKPFGFAFERVKAKGSVLHVHFGARQNEAAYDRGHINEVTVGAIGCLYDSTDRRPFICSTQGRDGHCHQ
jgi:hypothetical protein